MTDYARQNHFRNLQYFVDDGYSGTNFDRPDFRRMEQMIENGEIGTVIVKDMSRLGRNYLQIGIYTDIVFPENDVRFIAINDSVDSAVQTEFDMTPIRNFCNELYARDTAKKIKSTLKMKGESGKPLCSKAPYPAIIDEQTFEAVRKIREHKRRPIKTGKVSLFSGKVFCADCGAKLYYCTTHYFDESRDFFTCSQYRSNTGSCTVHYIRQQTLYELVFRHIKSMLVYVQQFEEAFVCREIEKADQERQISISNAKKEIVSLHKRDEELDILFKRTYEDMVSGRLSEARFDALSSEYEKEQAEVRARISELEASVISGEEQYKDLKRLLANVRKYTDPQELTAEMLNDLVDKIIVHAPDKSSGHRKQKIEIYYNAVGIINLPNARDDECTALHGRTQVNVAG